MNIDQIIARSRPGDTAVMESIVDQYQVRIYDLAYSMLRDETAANDVVQDTFLKVYDPCGNGGRMRWWRY